MGFLSVSTAQLKISSDYGTRDIISIDDLIPEETSAIEGASFNEVPLGDLAPEDEVTIIVGGRRGNLSTRGRGQPSRRGRPRRVQRNKFFLFKFYPEYILDNSVG